MADAENNHLDQDDVESAADPQQAAAAGKPPKSETEQLLDQAEENLAAAIGPELDDDSPAASRPGTAEPFEFSSFEPPEGAGDPQFRLEHLHDVELDMRVELGRAELLIDEVLRLKEGSVVPLDKLAGDPVDILVNGRLIARGEVLVLNDNFCVRVAEILAPDF